MNAPRVRPSAWTIVLCGGLVLVGSCARQDYKAETKATPPKPLAPPSNPPPTSRVIEPPPTFTLPFEGSLVSEGNHRASLTGKNGDPRFAPGVEGQALFTRGEGDWIEGGIAPGMNFPGSFSLEVWFRRDNWENPPRGSGGAQTMLTLSGRGGAHFKYITLHIYPGKNDGRLVASVDKTRLVSDRYFTEIEKWHYAGLVYEREKDTICLYVDAKRVARTKTDSAFLDWKINHLKLGTWHETNQAYRGRIDSLKVFDYARTPEMMKARMAARKD